MHFGIHVITNHLALEPVELARAVEERGFDSLWLGEHTHIPVERQSAYVGLADRSPPGATETEAEIRARRPDLRQQFWYMYDPLIALASAAAVTERIELGTAICLVVQRDPIILAKELATLDRISNGRVVLGIGTGWNREEMADHGVKWEDRFKVARERVLAMKAIWSEDEPEFHGEFVDFDPMWSYPDPVQPGGPKVLLGQNRTRTLDRVVDYCDGWIPTGGAMTVDELAVRIEDLRQIAEAAGRPFEELSVTAYSPTPRSAPDAEEQLNKLLKLPVDRILFNVGSPKRSLATNVLDELAEFLQPYR